MVRFKHRYFAVELVPLDAHAERELLGINQWEILANILKVVEQMHGEFGAAAVKNSLQVKYCNKQTHTAVIRVAHGPHRLVGSSLPFLSKIKLAHVQVKGIYTGAAIIKCLHFIKKYNLEKLNEALKLCKSNEQKQKLSEIIASVEKEAVKYNLK
nr:EOG090X0GYO [Macrothrix elegans]